MSFETSVAVIGDSKRSLTKTFQSFEIKFENICFLFINVNNLKTAFISTNPSIHLCLSTVTCKALLNRPQRKLGQHSAVRCLFSLISCYTN